MQLHDKNPYPYSILVEYNFSPIGSVPNDSDHKGYKPNNSTDMAIGNHDTGVDNQDTDSEYMWVPVGQRKDFSVEYKYNPTNEGNSQNLEASCKPVEIDLEGNSCLGVEQAADKWGPAELDTSGAQVDSAAT